MLVRILWIKYIISLKCVLLVVHIFLNSCLLPLRLAPLPHHFTPHPHVATPICTSTATREERTSNPTYSFQCLSAIQNLFEIVWRYSEIQYTERHTRLYKTPLLVPIFMLFVHGTHEALIARVLDIRASEWMIESIVLWNILLRLVHTYIHSLSYILTVLCVHGLILTVSVNN